MELINVNQSFLYNKGKSHLNRVRVLKQETIIPKEANDYVVVNISSWDMK